MVLFRTKRLYFKAVVFCCVKLFYFSTWNLRVVGGCCVCVGINRVCHWNRMRIMLCIQVYCRYVPSSAVEGATSHAREYGTLQGESAVGTEPAAQCKAALFAKWLLLISQRVSNSELPELYQNDCRITRYSHC